MSQVRKLQSGGSTKWGNLNIDTVDYDLNDPVIRQAFLEHLKQKPEYGDYYSDILNLLASGKDISGIGATNRIYGINEFSSASKRENKKLNSIESKTQKNWDALWNNDVHRGKGAIAHLLGFVMPSEEAVKAALKEINNSDIHINYDTNPDGTQKYSDRNPNNYLIKERINDYLTYLQDPEAWAKINKWGTDIDPEKDRALRAWYAQNANARDLLDEAFQAIESSNGWDTVPEHARELLEYLNIYGPKKEQNVTQSPSSYIDETGKIIRNKNNKGQWGTFRGTGEDGRVKDALYVASDDFGELPYLINADRLNLFEFPDNPEDYLNAIIYNGRIFKRNEIDQDVNLAQIMRNVETVNNSVGNPKELYDALSKIINFTDYGKYMGNYADYDVNKHYINKKALRDFFNENKITRASIFDATKGFETPEGYNIYGYYDFSNPGDKDQYGFRSPFYLVVDKFGNIQAVADEDGTERKQRSRKEVGWNELNREYDAFSGMSDLYLYDRKRYGRFIAKDEKGNVYHFVEDENGNVYHLDKDGIPILLDPFLGKKISDNRDNPLGAFNRDELTVSQNKARKGKTTEPSASGGRLKNGGKIRELPKKYQMGSRFLVNTPVLEELPEIDDPLSRGADEKYVGNLKLMRENWDKLSRQDRNDLRAALFDIGSAVSALVPGYGTIPAIGLGLASTGMLTANDIIRKQGFWKTARNTGLNLGLDLVSLVPYVGEGAAYAKIAKTINRAGHIIIPFFNIAGLGYASSAANKILKGEKLTTDDYRALAAGVASLLNIGHAGARRVQDASLVRTSNKARANVAENAPATTESLHKREVHLAEGEHPNAGTKQPVELSETEINTVLNETPEKSGKTLRKILTGENHNVLDTELPKDDAALLKQWGFDVETNHKWIRLREKSRKAEGKIKSVAETEPAQLSPESKFTYLKSLYRGQKARSEAIDEAMKNSSIRSEIENLKEKGEWGLARQLAYNRSRNRIGETSWRKSGIGTKPDEEKTPETTKKQGNKENVQNESNSQNQNQSGNTNVNENVNTESKTLVPEEITRPEVKALPGTEKPLALPENKIIYLPNRINTPEENIIYLPERMSEKLSSSVEQAPKLGKSSSITYKQATMSERARNLERLRKSSNPLKTLSDLEKSKQDKLFTSEEELYKVLEDVLVRNKVTRGNKKAGNTYENKLYEKIENLVKSGRAYEKGGVLKGQTGIDPSKWKKTIFDNLELFNTKPRTSYYDPNIDLFNTRTKSAVDTTWENRPDWEKNWEKQVTTVGDGKPFQFTNLGLGGPQGKFGLNKKPWSDDFYVSLLRYYKSNKAANKFYDQQIEAAKNGIIQQDLLPYNSGIRTDNPYYDQYQNILQNQLSAGFKPVSSNLDSYYAAKLTQQDKYNQSMKDILAQKAGYFANALAKNYENWTNTGIKNNEISFANRGRIAAGNAAIGQYEAARTAQLQNNFNNFATEVENRLYQDRKLKTNKQMSDLQLSQQQEMEKNLRNWFPAEWKAWNTSVIQSEYDSFADYVEKTNPVGYNKRRRKIEEITSQNSTDLANIYYDNNLNFPILSRKGGTVNGSTRYTLEPDERIWIDNNKAAHKAIAKLSDNAIKLLLRALK